MTGLMICELGGQCLGRVLDLKQPTATIVDDRPKCLEIVRLRAREIGAMGKVKDEVSASKPSKPGKGKSGGSSRGLFSLFLVNLTRADLFKPMQGWYARVYTAWGWV